DLDHRHAQAVSSLEVLVAVDEGLLETEGPALPFGQDHRPRLVAEPARSAGIHEDGGPLGRFLSGWRRQRLSLRAHLVDTNLWNRKTSKTAETTTCTEGCRSGTARPSRSCTGGTRRRHSAWHTG